MTTNRSQNIFPSKVPIIYIGVILFMTKSNHQFIPLLSKYFNTASKHTAKPYDASAVGLDYILSTRCPKALRTHNHLVSEPSSPLFAHDRTPFGADRRSALRLLASLGKLGCGLSLSSTFLPDQS